MEFESLKIMIAADRMAAFIRLSSDAELSAQDLRDALAREGITSGVSPVALRQALEGQRGVFYQVAWGRKSETALSASGKAPVILFRFAGSQGEPPSSMVPGPGFRAAWKKLRDRGAVSAGDILAFARNAEAYPRAVSVMGDEVSCIEFTSRCRPARNARVSRDGNSVVSTRPGIPYQSDDGVGVLDHVSIEGDVDGSTGDVAFPGDLSIHGNVDAGVKVSATGNILVSGSLWGSATARGKIVVGGGINAPGEVVESGGGITCRFCENSLLRSAKNIEVGEAVVHSVIETESMVIVDGDKGKIAGGLVRAGIGVRANVAGTPMGVPTVIEVGVSPRLRHEQARLDRELEKVRADLEQARREGGRKMTSTGDYDALRLIRMKRMWEDQERALSQRVESFRETLQHLPKGYFQATHVLAGVRLVMGTDVKEFTSSLDRISMGAMPREAD